MILSNSRHDHIRNSVVLFRKKSRNSCAVAPRAQAILFFPVPKGRYLATFALRSSFGESASCEHVSTTYGAKPIQGFWRSQERKDISRGSGRAWISKPEVHGAHVSLFLHLTKSVICSKNTFTCTNRVTPQVFFQTPHTLQVKNARSMSWGAAHERTNAVSSVFFMLIGETAATCVDVG